MDQSGKDSNYPPAAAVPSITVDRLPGRTVAPHGMTGAELNRLNGAVRFIDRHRGPRRGLWCLHTNKEAPRSTISAIQKRITRLQIEHGLRPYNVTTFETRGGLHAHIVFLGKSRDHGAPEKLDRLRRFDPG
jgi:hypothetical protein